MTDLSPIAKAMEGVTHPDAPEWIAVAQDGKGHNGGFWTCAAATSESPRYIRADIYAALALQLEAMKREMAEKDERIAALEAGLKPFAGIADVFDFPGGNRPTQGIIAAWSDHRIGDREFTVESVRRARTLIQGEKQ